VEASPNKGFKIQISELEDLGANLQQCLTDPQLQSLGETEVVCGEFKVRVHRAILCARCPQLLEEIDEGTGERIDLTGLWPPDVVKMALLYVYSGESPPVSEGRKAAPWLRQGSAMSSRDLPALCMSWGLPPSKQWQRDKPSLSKSPHSSQGAEASLLGASFSHLVDNEQESDVRFLLQSHTGEVVHVYSHRIILAARSEYFRRMFFSGFREGQFDGNRIDVRVPTKSAECYRLLLEGLYTGSVAVSETLLQEVSSNPAQSRLADVAREIFEAGDEYCLDGFKAVADDLLLLGTEVTKENVADLTAASRTRHLDPVADRCRDFVSENLGSLLENRALMHALPFHLKEKAWERSMLVQVQVDSKRLGPGVKALKTQKHVHASPHSPKTALPMMSSRRANGIDRTARCFVDCGPA
jgi:hypothetical protein